MAGRLAVRPSRSSLRPRRASPSGRRLGVTLRSAPLRRASAHETHVASVRGSHNIRQEPDQRRRATPSARDSPGVNHWPRESTSPTWSWRLPSTTWSAPVRSVTTGPTRSPGAPCTGADFTAAGPGPRGRPAQPSRPRTHQVHRHEQGEGGAGRPGRRHRRRLPGRRGLG